MKTYFALTAVAFLAACTTKNDVAMNRDYQGAALASEQARYAAIASIAKQGEVGAVAAAMMLQQNNTSIKAPNTNVALDWAKVIVPAVTAGVGIAANAGVAVRQSDNSRDVALTNSNNNKDIAINTNQTMATIAEVTIVKPEVVQPNVTIACISELPCEFFPE